MRYHYQNRKYHILFGVWGNPHLFYLFLRNQWGWQGFCQFFELLPAKNIKI